MGGLLAISGGREHTHGCEDIDQRLLRESGVSRPTVTVLLAATRDGRRDFKIAEATAYWRPFNVDLQIGYTGRSDDADHALTLLENPDLVVLTGGYPWLIHHRLARSPVLERIKELSHQGVPVSGSSAGAMVLCQWWPILRPPDPLRLVAAFGLLPNAAVAPHFEHFKMDRFARLAVRRHADINAIGLPNCTAIVGRANEFTVHGTGVVSLINRREEGLYPRGATLQLHPA